MVSASGATVAEVSFGSGTGFRRVSLPFQAGALSWVTVQLVPEAGASVRADDLSLTFGE
jgi:hypothetical protein